MAKEQEIFDWCWINARRAINANSNTSASLAPASWKEWVAGGIGAVEKTRRRVAKLMTTSVEDQKCAKGSTAERVLALVFKYYEGRKSRFESLASLVTASVIRRNGGDYTEGWDNARIVRRRCGLYRESGRRHRTSLHQDHITRAGKMRKTGSGNRRQPHRPNRGPTKAWMDWSLCYYKLFLRASAKGDH